MRYSETEQLFKQTFEFPVDHHTVIDRIGDVELTTPAGDTVTIRATLERTDESRYHSSEGLYTSLMRDLEDGFIGRKYYDDRAGTQSDPNNKKEDMSI